MQHRWTVQFETNGNGTSRERWFPSLSLAVTFAKRATADGTAWPSEAHITRQQRESPFHDWRLDHDTEEVCVIDGELQ